MRRKRKKKKTTTMNKTEGRRREKDKDKKIMMGGVGLVRRRSNFRIVFCEDVESS